MTNTRIGLIGCGFMGRMHSEVYGALEGVTLAHLCDKDEPRAEKIASGIGAASSGSLDDLLADESLEVIDICLPTDLHAEATVKALESGKHVICEKPMAIDLESADRMIAAAKASGKRLMIAHCIRFWPEYEVLESLTKTQKLGKLLSLNLTRYGAFPTWSVEDWLSDEKRAGGGALDMHIHDTDYALYLLGTPKKAVSFGTVDKRGVSQIFTTFAYDGQVAHLEGGWNLPATAPFKMAFRAIFERGAAIMDAGPLTIYEDGKDPVEPELPKMAAKGTGGNVSDLGGYYYELKYFFEQLHAGRPLDRISVESSRLTLATTLEEIAQVKGGV